MDIERITLIDLTCMGCGSTMSFVEPDVKYEVRASKNNEHVSVVVANSQKTGLQIHEMKCSHCERMSAIWIPAEQTKAFNGWNSLEITTKQKVSGKNNRLSSTSVVINGNVTGSNVIIGSNNNRGSR